MHALLVRHQIADGAFTESLGRPYFSLEATHDAIELMTRFGVPQGVDVLALHRHLRRPGRMWTAAHDVVPLWHFVMFTDRLNLEALVGVPHRSSFRTLLEERTFLAITALVLLCVYAVWAAPRAIPASAGAMP